MNETSMTAVDSSESRSSAASAGETRTVEDDAHSRDHMAEIGRKGGLSRKQQLGMDGYKSLGRKGGQIVSRNREHMAEIGRRGGLARKSNRQRSVRDGGTGIAPEKPEIETKESALTIDASPSIEASAAARFLERVERRL